MRHSKNPEITMTLRVFADLLSVLDFLSSTVFGFSEAKPDFLCVKLEPLILLEFELVWPLALILR